MKKRNYAPFAIVLFGVMAASGIAQTTQRLTCAAWTSERNQGGNRELQVENWLDGYLAGLSDGSGDSFATVIDQPSSYLWMDNYCRTHPLDNATDAGVFLINELLKKKRPYKHQY